LEPGGRLGGRDASRARAGTVRAAGASRHRAARAREVLAMESFLSARAAGTSSLRSSKKQSRWRG